MSRILQARYCSVDCRFVQLAEADDLIAVGRIGWHWLKCARIVALGVVGGQKLAVDEVVDVFADETAVSANDTDIMMRFIEINNVELRLLLGPRELFET